MKHLTVALAAIGLVSSVKIFAALPAATDPTLINIPQLPGGFFLGGTGYYLQPASNHGDLDYVIVDQITAPFNSRIENVDPSYDWGWGVNAGYIFPNTGNDVNVSYFNLDTDDSASAGGVNIRLVNPTSTLIGGTFATGAAKAKYTINQVDATVGQFVNVGCRLILHPDIGLRWADLDREIDGTFIRESGTPVVTTVVATKEKSDFNGIGPLLGLDASYYIGYGFGAVGHFDSAVLVGDVDSKLDVVTTFSNSPIVTTNEFKLDDQTRISPIIDAKLGLDYTYIFFNAASSDLTLEAGWQFSEYFNAVHRVFGFGAGNAGATGSKTSSLGLNGPYASLVLHI